jgi:hypothetical protein
MRIRATRDSGYPPLWAKENGPNRSGPFEKSALLLAIISRRQRLR